MGYSCPVCGDPQADDLHLANHLAFTALVRGGDHEEWLDEYVPDWDQRDDEGLAELVVEHAEETEFPQVFEDTTGHDHEHTHADSELPPGTHVRSDGVLDEDAREILEEAREMTRTRRQNGGDSETE